MIIVTSLMRQWINCSNDVWLRWFVSRENGIDEFMGVEEFLLGVFVLQKSGTEFMNLSSDQFFEKLKVKYLVPVNESRQICVKQRAGNVFCNARFASIQKSAIFKVKTVDTMGTMQDGQPYVEVFYGDGYILESPDHVEFMIE